MIDPKDCPSARYPYHGQPGRICPYCQEVTRCTPGSHLYIAGLCLNCSKKEVEDLNPRARINLCGSKEWLSLRLQGRPDKQPDLLFWIPRAEVSLVQFLRTKDGAGETLIVHLKGGKEVRIDGEIGEQVTFDDIERILQ